jgi:hypothetical protein
LREKNYFELKTVENFDRFLRLREFVETPTQKISNELTTTANRSFGGVEFTSDSQPSYIG